MGNMVRPFLRKRKAGLHGLSLIEILVVTAIVSILTWLVGTGISHSRASAKNAQCLSNLRQIHQAMMFYCAENEAYPLPSEDQALQDLLKPWLGGCLGVFHCPEDAQANPDSYSYFYAPRSPTAPADSYVLGCPRHQKFTRGIAVYAGSQTEISPMASVTHNGGSAIPGNEYNYGTFQFGDGSTVSLENKGGHEWKENEHGHQAELRSNVSTLYSIQRADGTCYTVVKIREGAMGVVQFSVVPGNRFDVVTAASVIAVRGTQFSVETLKQGGEYATRVEVTEGIVEMQPVSRGNSLKLDASSPGQSKGFAVKGGSPNYE